MELETLQHFTFTAARAQQLALLAMFDAMAEMLGSNADEFRMRFIRHLQGRADPSIPEARWLNDIAAEVAAQASGNGQKTPRSN